MLPWYSLANVQMANNLIKWWRTKFLNGYKQFSVLHSDGSDGRPSDTEELLAGHGLAHEEHGFGLNEAAMPTCSTPPASPYRAATPTPKPPTPQPTPDKKHLNLEEFSCDVSMEGGIYRDGQERQEFSFTLYDFDGHGKITKDDIAGLVTTIYETLGSSVKVPHYGSKTIKVKLTVSPDQGKRVSATVIDHKSPEHTTTDSGQQQEDNGVHVKRDLNVTIKDSQRHRRQCRRHKQKQEQQEQHICCNFVSCKDSTVNTATADVSDVEHEYSDHCSRVSEDELSEDEGECSEDQMPKHPSCEKIKTRRYQKFNSPRHQAHMNATTVPNAHVPISPVLCTKARRTKKRSSSLQRKELLEIIQANMDKNNHGFQNSSRKQCPNHVTIESEQTPSIERKQHRHKHKANRDSAAQLQCLANIVNSENCYLDLATLHNGATQIPIDGQNGLKNVPYCRYDKLLGAVVCMSNKQISNSLLQRSPLSHSPCRNRRHYRSRSHDLSQVPFRYHLLEPHNNLTNKCSNLRNEVTENISPKSVKKNNAKLKSYEAEFEQTPAAFKKNIKKFPQVVLGHSSSPHHLKHRNRQEDQARAMAQVVRWLEQEFSSNVNMNKKSDGTKKNKCNSRPSPNKGATSPSVSAVERHEHHHVHEHIHHHYHHYQEAPVVV